MNDCSRRTFLLTLAASSGALVTSRPASATTVRGLELSELVRASQRVIVATALGAESRFERSRSGRRIVTDVRVRLEESWLGPDPAPSELFVKIYGGRVDDEAELVVGQPEFIAGERSLLFLMEKTSGPAVVTGMSQGQYRLLRGNGGELRLSPPKAHVRIANRERSAVARLAGLELAAARRLVLGVPR